MQKVRKRSDGLPVPPAEIADEVELYARASGRHATLHFVPTVMVGRRIIRATWMARFTLRADDSRLSLFQEGRVEEPPTDDVWFHEPNPDAGKLIDGTDGVRESDYRGLDIIEMGASGVRSFLERGDLWSGRGQFDSLEDQVRQVRAANAATKAKNRADAKEANRFQQREKRRLWMKLPIVRVGIDLLKKVTRPHVSPDLGTPTNTKEKAS